ncbi:MAG: pyrrolo-quinoline quinone [Eubacteriales bacterium]|nr:pyrrolo-quinoline quinone [Eubacteriales bacterium]
MKKKTLKKYYVVLIILAVLISAAVVFGSRISDYIKGLSSDNKPGQTDNSNQTTPKQTDPTTGGTTPSPSETQEPTVPPTTEPPLIEHKVVDECLPENFKGFSYQIIVNDKVVTDYIRENEIFFGPSDEYTDVKGLTTFRGNNWRDTPSFGTVDVKEGKLEKIWWKRNGYIDIWTGAGWTGQPLIIEWDDATKRIMNLNEDKKQKDGLKEIIYATLDGKIYFMDLDDGSETRPPINVGYPHKGNATLDPRGIPLLYAGQGVGEKGGVSGPFGFRIFNLLNQERLLFIDGRDKFAYRGWGAFDAAALVDAETDTLIQVGENGIIYSVDLNTKYNPDQASLSIDPDIVRLRYKSPYDTRIGIENSPIGYRNYIYFVDNTGLLMCIDVNTLKPVWLRYVNDDTDSTMVLEEINRNEAYLYTACEVDWQGKGGKAYIRKINAFTGELIWEYPVDAYYNKDSNGGALATPVLGKKDISHLIIFNIAKVNSNGNGSKLLAFNRVTGKVEWEVDMNHYCWSSPVDFYTPEGKSYLIVSDSGGNMRLLDGLTGTQLDSVNLELNIESTPAIYGDMIVVGTRGQKIWGVKIK